MTKSNTLQAIEDARRFIARAQEALDEAKPAKAYEVDGESLYCPSIKCSATKRASMDLTRSLAELRKSR